MKRYLAALSAVALCSVLSPFASAATIQFASALPDTNVLASNPTATSGNIQVRNMGASGSNNRWLGVTFSTTASAALDQVTFFVDTAHSPASAGNAASLGAGMTISIYSITSLTSVPGTSATALWSETATVPNSYTSEGYMTFDLDTPYTLASGSSYAIVISFNSAASNRGINLLQASSSASGQNNVGQTILSYDQGVSYSTITAPLNFVLQGVAVPEASSLSLLLIAGLGLIAKRSGQRVH